MMNPKNARKGNTRTAKKSFNHEFLAYERMSYTLKIKKPKGAQPDDFEVTVAQALIDLEQGTAELKADLSELYFVKASELDLTGGRKAVVIFVPFKQLKDYHKIQSRLIRELEKKFSGRHVIFVANRTILAPSCKRKADKGMKGPRPVSRTLTAVHEALLEDIVYPTEIVGKRIRYKLDGSKTLKVFLDAKDQHQVETKLDTFGEVYKNITHKEVSFEFPVEVK